MNSNENNENVGESMTMIGMPGVDGHTLTQCRDSLVLYGGKVSSIAFNPHVFALDLGTNEWSFIQTKLADSTENGGWCGIPPARAYHTAVRCRYLGRGKKTKDESIIVFGGLLAIGVDDLHYNNYNVFVNTDFLSVDVLHRRGQDRLKPKDSLPSLVQARLEERSLYVLDLSAEATWSRPETTGRVPPSRSHHTATMLDDVRMAVYGGYDVTSTGRATDDYVQALEHVFILNVGTMVWECVETRSSIPPHVWGHTLCLHGDALVQFGGVDLDKGLETSAVNVFDLARREWKKSDDSMEHGVDTPTARAGHTAVTFANTIIVFGGFTEINSKLFHDIHVLDLATGHWRRVHAATPGESVPLPRAGHAAVVVGTRMYVSGGYDHAFHRTSRLWSLDLVTWEWSAVPTTYCGESPAAHLHQYNLDTGRALDALKALRRKAIERDRKLQEAFAGVKPELLLKRVKLQPRDPLHAFRTRAAMMTPDVSYPLSIPMGVFGKKDSNFTSPAAQTAAYLQNEIAAALYYEDTRDFPDDIMSPKRLRPIREQDLAAPTYTSPSANSLSKYGFIDLRPKIGDDLDDDAHGRNVDKFKEKQEFDRLATDIRRARQSLLTNLDSSERAWNLQVMDADVFSSRNKNNNNNSSAIGSAAAHEPLWQQDIEASRVIGSNYNNPPLSSELTHAADAWKSDLEELRANREQQYGPPIGHVGRSSNAIDDDVVQAAPLPNVFTVKDSYAVQSAQKMRDDIISTPRKRFVSRSVQKLGLSSRLSHAAIIEQENRTRTSPPARGGHHQQHQLDYGPISSMQRREAGGPISRAHRMDVAAAAAPYEYQAPDLGAGADDDDGYYHKDDTGVFVSHTNPKYTSVVGAQPLI